MAQTCGRLCEQGALTIIVFAVRVWFLKWRNPSLLHSRGPQLGVCKGHGSERSTLFSTQGSCVRTRPVGDSLLSHRAAQCDPMLPLLRPTDADSTTSASTTSPGTNGRFAGGARGCTLLPFFRRCVQTADRHAYRVTGTITSSIGCGVYPGVLWQSVWVLPGGRGIQRMDLRMAGSEMC